MIVSDKHRNISPSTGQNLRNSRHLHQCLAIFKKKKIPAVCSPSNRSCPTFEHPTRGTFWQFLPKRKTCQWNEVAVAARAADSAEPRVWGHKRLTALPNLIFFFPFCRDSCRLLSSSGAGKKTKHEACFDTPTKEGASRAGLAGAKGSEREGGGWRLKALPLQTVCGAEKAGGAAQERVGWVGGWGGPRSAQAETPLSSSSILWSCCLKTFPAQ